MNWSIAVFMLLIGIENPRPWEPPDRDAIQVLIPITSPYMFTNGPPEFPWLIAASVWMKSLMEPICLPERPVALTIPCVTEAKYPRGLPSARTISPCWTTSESPSFEITIDWSLDSNETSAISILSSPPTNFPSNSRSSFSLTFLLAVVIIPSPI